MLERFLLGGLCLGPVRGGHRTKLGVCRARIRNLVFGENLHGFDVEVEAMLRLGRGSGFADERERVAKAMSMPWSYLAFFQSMLAKAMSMRCLLVYLAFCNPC